MHFWDFLALVVLLWTIAYVILTAIRASFGYPIPGRGGKVAVRELAGASVGELQRLTSENVQLKERLTGMEQRLTVLERIATDPAERTAREIEQLR